MNTETDNRPNLRLGYARLWECVRDVKEDYVRCYLTALAMALCMPLAYIYFSIRDRIEASK